MEDIFLPVQGKRASEEVLLQIEAAILSSKIKAGERLPSERELQAQFKTGRGVVREALRALRQKGLIEVRKGAAGGAFVKEIDVSNVSESLALFLKQHPINPEMLIEFREGLDRSITALAIARADEDEKARLLQKAEALEATLKEPDQGLAVLAEADRELNIMLAQMTKNPIYEWIMRALQQGFSSYDIALYQDEEFRMDTICNWADTARAIAHGEPVQALSYIGLHYALLRRRLKNRTIAQPTGFSPETAVEVETGKHQ
jgi:DNA-binding FadR family transcriptional regulator